MATPTIQIGKLSFRHPLVVNAGGTLKNWGNLPDFLKTNLQIVLFGAALEPLRPGNPGGILATLFVQNVAGGIKLSYNRLGLPERYGITWYRQHLAEKNSLVADHGKVLAMNIAGFSVDEFARLASVCHTACVHIIFADISCANTSQEPHCFYPEAAAEIIREVRAAAPNATIGVKLPYIPLPSLLTELVDICKKGGIGIIEVINAMGQYHPIDERGVRRLGGPASGGGFLAKDPAQGMVARVKTLLGENPTIHIMATGGIGCGPGRAGQDILDYERLGATLFGVHTAARSTNPPYSVMPQVFDAILDDYNTIALLLRVREKTLVQHQIRAT